MKCRCCQSDSSLSFSKKGYDYWECNNCKTLFVPSGINQSDMVGGGFEQERNEIQNKERTTRFIWLVGVYGNILDYGCGHGMLVKDCNEAKLNCDGYDKFNGDFPLIKDKKYNLISMVEVIEHLYYPYFELNEIHSLLKDDGLVYIETSFTDIIPKPYEEAYYVEPSVGHCTIFSHKGLDLLMESKGFKALDHINDNVRLYKKQ